jgi:hypothetical protein
MSSITQDKMEMFTGTLITSRPLTTEELKEYGNVYSKSDDMYMTFVEWSPNELEGPCYSKVSRYVDMKKGFHETFEFLKSKDISFHMLIDYANLENGFIGYIEFGFVGAIYENVTRYKIDFNGVQHHPNVIY